MTLVLACLTENLVVVGADRRLTTLPGELHDDYASKMLIFQGRAAFAYTGLATLDGRPTDEWLADELRQHTHLEPLFESLSTRATLALARSASPDKRFAVLAVGWVTFRRRTPRLPTVVIASNFWNSSSGWEQRARWQVEVTQSFLPRE
jgi:hypothetical protein